MARAGFEADKRVLTLYDRKSKTLKPVSDNLDFSVGQFIWSPDSKFIYFTSANEIYNSIFKINIETKESSVVLKERVNSGIVLRNDGKTLFFKQQRSTQPYEIFSLNNDGLNLKQITFVNKETLDKIEMNEVETFWSEGAEGAKVQSILVKPPFFDEKKKYPLIFLIHGGPQGHWTDDFHYRWNLQMFASGGYVIVAVNPRGSTGYGQAFCDAIRGDWGGKPLVDLQKGLAAALQKYPWMDGDRVAALGASYGGYMINWIAGNWPDRFTCLVAHDGNLDERAAYYQTEELWFPEWDHMGTPWSDPEHYEAQNPVNFVQNWKTPMLIIHGGRDYRVDLSGGIGSFTACQRRGIPSKFLYFPDENHWVLQPQNSILWHDTVIGWLDQWTKQ